MNPRVKGYENYGGRGIFICAGWDAFPDFIADMGEKPDWATGGIDRIDNEGGYWCGHCEECKREGHPANCRWATKSDQGANRRKKVAA